MRLRSIDALRFGLLENERLEGLGDELTIVLGPNESGKTTYTTLVRHVLFGFPTKVTAEKRYEPPAGAGRAGRLVFEADGSRWAIERTEGVRGGPVTVTTLAGADRPDLLATIVGGVTDQEFRVIYGFGIDELAKIESGEGSAILARLYAATTGLDVNPQSVRDEILAAQEALFKPGAATKPMLNDLVRQMRENRDVIRRLTVQADEIAEQQERLAEVTEDLAPLKSTRDALDTQRRALALDAERVTSLAATERAATRAVEEARARIAQLGEEASRHEIDSALADVAPELKAALAELPAFRERLSTAATRAALAEDAERRAALLGAVPDAEDSPEIRARVEREAAALAKAEIAAEQSDDRAREAESVLTEAEKAAAQAATRPGPAQAGGPRRFPLGWVLLGIGAVLAAAGFAVGNILAGVFGIVFAIGGLAVELVSRASVETARISATPMDLERLRTEATSARKLAKDASNGLERRRAEWRAWLKDSGLDGEGDDPVAVKALLDRAREHRQLVSEADGFRRDQADALSSARAWADRLDELSRGILARPSQELDTVPEFAGRLQLLLDEFAETCSARERVERTLAEVSRDLDRMLRDAKAASDEIAEIAGRRGVDVPEASSALDALVAVTSEQHADAAERYETLFGEQQRLLGELREAERTDAMARARQADEGLRSQAMAVADRYLVLALAGRLLDRAQAVFERERQPAVVKRAERLFAEMTGGRYERLVIPAGGGAITIVASDGSTRSTAELSRGTAEQLYLALRVGVITQLGQAGEHLPVLMDDIIVNFDPERRVGAAKAIAELASSRQVVFFTCHDETAEVLESTTPHCTVLRLDRCGLRE